MSEYFLVGKFVGLHVGVREGFVDKLGNSLGCIEGLADELGLLEGTFVG